MKIRQKGKLQLILFIIILILILIGVVGFLVWEIGKQPPSTSPSIPQLPTQPTLPEKPTNWQLYKNEEYGFEFKYPKEWGELKIELPENESDFSYKKILTQQIENGVFSFIPENSKIVKVWYHPKSKTLAFLKKGKEITTIDENSWYQGQLFAGKDLNFSLIFEIPESIAKWYGSIPFLNFSPDGNYLVFNLIGWEDSFSYIINRKTQKDILKPFLEFGASWSKIVHIENIYNDIVWAPNSNALAFISTPLSIGGRNIIPAILVSEYKNPEKLQVIYSLEDIPNLDYWASDFYNIEFSEDGKTFSFEVVLKKMDNLPPTVKIYKYNLITKELKETESWQKWKL